MNISKLSFVSQKYDNYKMLDIIRYIFSIIIIVVHSNQDSPVGSQTFLSFFINNIVGRVTVPFFFMLSAYFVRKSSQKNTQYIKQYLISTTKSYLFWSLIFIPIGLAWVQQNLTIPIYLLPFVILYGLIHIGTYYHLWYIPAMLFSIFLVHKLRRYFSYKCLCIVCTLLFAFGSIESYYGLLPAGTFRDLFDLFINIMTTTRTGLFYSMIFILMGFYIADHQKKLHTILTYVPMLTMLSMILLTVEGALLYQIPHLDMNFLLGLIPFSFFFFLFILSFPYKLKCDTHNIRNLSKYYYFIHPACIMIIEQIGYTYDIRFLSTGFISFLLIVLFTHLLSLSAMHSQKSKNIKGIVFSVLWGFLFTSILTAIMLFLKTANQPLRFELIPCIWFVSSFAICYFISKGKKH